MIDLHYFPTPNAHKVTIFLEETGLPYRIVPVDIMRGEQFRPEFLAIAPNNRIPAIVDHAPVDGGAPVTVFESGAILLYLADKTGRFVPADLRGRNDAIQWLFWQMAGLGPMAGQAFHFLHAAKERIPYAVDRYTRETARLFAVLDKRLADRDYLAKDYSIADMACFGWLPMHALLPIELADFPNVRRWFDAISARPAVQRALAISVPGEPPKLPSQMTAEEKRLLYGQDASSVR